MVDAKVATLTYLQDVLDRLRSARWFNTLPTARPMSLAEHGYSTALIALALATELKLPPAEEATLLRRALLHDLEEAYTGDITSMAKRAMSPVMRAAWQELAHNELRTQLPKALNSWANAWLQAKAADRPGQLLRAADYYAMWLYVRQELAMGNTAAQATLQRIMTDYIATLPVNPWREALTAALA